VYAIGNVASEIDLLVVAEAQGTIVAHDAYRKLRGGVGGLFLDGVFEVNTSEKLVCTGPVHCTGRIGL